MNRQSVTGTRRRLFGLTVALVWIAATTGCALMSKSTPLELRYFSPEKVEATAPGIAKHGAVADASSAGTARIRLGRLTSAANLRYRIVHRESAVELDTYETLRWTETPLDYVRRSLSRALYDDGPFEQVVGGPALTLDVTVVSFEEARRDKRPVGRVQLAYWLHDERSVLVSGVVTVERAAESEEIEPVVVAIGSAMDAATAQLTAELAAAEHARAATTGSRADQPRVVGR